MIKFKTRVKRLERKKRLKRATKVGDSIKTEEEDLGWAILLEGSWEWLFIGEDDANMKVGDEVEVTIARVV
jgi:hypothetical protein